jgi:undecaprenyl-phosphate 4-deoxy-4-formamido-L-arabinose transferase
MDWSEAGLNSQAGRPALITGHHLSQCPVTSFKKSKLSSSAKVSKIFGSEATLKRELVSIVIPVYNEAANLPPLWARLRPILSDSMREWEIVFVDDGSTDASLEILTGYGREDARVRVVELARNFGQHSALLAGFRNSRGDVVVTLDADLQNPPEEIPRLLEAIAQGNDVVGGWREERQDRTYRRMASQMHNRITSAIVGVPMHDYGCMLRAYRRHIVDTVVACDEKAAFVPALANSFAKRVAEIPVQHAERHDGESKYNLFRLAHLSLNLITGFSNFPIQAMSLAAIGIFFLDALFVVVLLVHRLVYGPQQEGAVWVLFAFTFALLGLLLLALGLIGEYIGRIYLEVRRRPTYIVRAIHSENSGDPAATRGGVGE